MNWTRCPYLDELGKRLIEAYRRVEGGDDSPIERSNGSDIDKLHKQVASHSHVCPLCVRFEQLDPDEFIRTQLLRPSRRGGS